MKNRNEISRREKSATVGLVVCFVAMIAIVGLITFNQYERGVEEQRKQQLAEAQEKENMEQEKWEKPDESQSANTDSVQAELSKPIVEEPPVVETPIVDAAPAPAQSALRFAPTDDLLWPVDGNVLLSYSMDKTVYFSTLDQYKYNPALIIAGEIGGDVLAAADGEITSIEVNAQTGTTLTMKLGDGYELVYGQVKEVCVQEGDHVERGDLLGYVSEPTKYYSVEGPNLYFQLLKDGEPVNPLEHLEG